MPTLLERANEQLRDRKKLITDARALLEKEEITAEDRERHSEMLDDAEEKRVEADRLRRQHEAEASVGELRDAVPPEDGGGSAGGSAGEPWEARTRFGGNLGIPAGERVYRADPGTPEYARSRPEYEEEFRGLLRGGRPGQYRALQAGADDEGGYTVVPQQFMTGLIKAVDDAVMIRPLATVHQIPNAASLGQASLENDPADAAWTSELAIGSEDSTMDFGKRELRPHPLAKYIKVSKKLIRASGENVDAIVRDRLAYKFGITEEKGFLTGSGASQPLGVFTASDDGIGTARDVSTGNTTSSMTFDGLINAKYNQKGQYWPRCRWIFHRDGVKQIATLKDGNGQYIWRESARAGEPDMLLGFPILMSENAPNTFTTGKYVGILGDFSFYWIAEALDMSVQVLLELFAATNQNGYIGRMEVDGMPVLAEAFTRVKLG